uniref:Uncharacterized protein n=1 Tax=Strigops habroptila TaxID=2489341 RepID=A0A672UK79_STRHB
CELQPEPLLLVPLHKVVVDDGATRDQVVVDATWGQVVVDDGATRGQVVVDATWGQVVVDDGATRDQVVVDATWGQVVVDDGATWGQVVVDDTWGQVVVDDTWGQVVVDDGGTWGQVVVDDTRGQVVVGDKPPWRRPGTICSMEKLQRCLLGHLGSPKAYLLGWVEGTFKLIWFHLLLEKVAPRWPWSRNGAFPSSFGQPMGEELDVGMKGCSIGTTSGSV